MPETKPTPVQTVYRSEHTKHDAFYYFVRATLEANRVIEQRECAIQQAKAKVLHRDAA